MNRNADGRSLAIVDGSTSEALYTGTRQQTTSDLETAARRVVRAHVIELRQAEVIDDEAYRLIARSLGTIAERSANPTTRLSPLLQSVEEVVDGGLPAAVRGVATLGPAREEWAATVERVAWRECSLGLNHAVSTLQSNLLRLASVHAVTVMPAHAGGRLVQPTTLAHYLGGVIEPLRDVRGRLREGFSRLNRSPLGAGLLAGSAMGADRDDLASRLGFAGPVPSTFAAVAVLEDAVEVVDLAASVVSTLGRFIGEILTWQRTDATSFFVDERWLSRPEPSNPSLEVPSRLDTLQARIEGSGDALDGWRRELRRVGYGPVGNRRDNSVQAAIGIERTILPVIDEAAEFVSEGLIVNRAYLGNRAGRAHVTGGDLAYFLMGEEGIPPPPALEIASLVLAQLRDSHLEVSGITQDMIDSAALLTIGREIKVEMETLGRYLAPRRYLERRQVTGSAAPNMTRVWLETVEQDQRAEDAWLAQTSQSIALAISTLDQTLEAVGNESPDN